MIGEKLRINRTGLVAVDLVATYAALFLAYHLRFNVEVVPVTKGVPPFEPVPRPVPDHHPDLAGGLLLPRPARRAARSAPGSRRRSP